MKTTAAFLISKTKETSLDENETIEVETENSELLSVSSETINQTEDVTIEEVLIPNDCNPNEV